MTDACHSPFPYKNEERKNIFQENRDTCVRIAERGPGVFYSRCGRKLPLRWDLTMLRTRNARLWVAPVLCGSRLGA
jgi:hypothetical protein